MRRILNFTSNKLALPKRVAGMTRTIKLVASLAVTLSTCGLAHAQSTTGHFAQQLAPTALSLNDNPVSSAMAIEFGGQQFQTVPASEVEVAYSVLSQDAESAVQPAAALGQRIRRSRNNMYSPTQQNPCYAGCDVSYYGRYEALWLRREGDQYFSLSRNTFLPDFEFDWNGRYTIGQLFDCVNGWEASYTGPFDWQRNQTITGAGFQSNLVPFNGYTAADVDAFNNATLHSQAWRSQLHSIELNRTWWVWDVLSTMIGARFIDYEEDYAFLSTSAAGTGLLTESVDNQMAGLQIGANLLYPTSLRSSVGFRGKAGVFANFDERRATLVNAGTVVVNAGDTNVDLAGIVEVGIFTQYQIVPSIRVTAGYEAWWMPGVATIPEQGPARITPATGTFVFNEDDLFLHGFSAGGEILF